MIDQDRILICRDCSGQFTLSPREQGLNNIPSRCPKCRAKRNPGRKSAQESPKQSDQQPQKQTSDPASKQKTRQSGKKTANQSPKTPRKESVVQGAKRTVSKLANETYIAPCSVCGKDAVLRFRPTGLLPVYCKECFEAQLNAPTRVSQRELFLDRGKRSFQDVFAPEEAASAGPSEVAPEAFDSTAGQTAAGSSVVSEVETARPDRGDGSFADFELDPRLERAVREAGYEIPTPVQSATIPIGLRGRDLIGTAQTGTGKTAAFSLPILQHLLTRPVGVPRTRALVLTPTRELAEQVSDTFKVLGGFTRIKTATVYGGVGMGPQEHALRTGVEVIVACPGRLLDHIERGNTDLTNVEILVLDEADRMLDMGFLPSIKRVLSYLPSERQTMLFSATFAPELNELAAQNMRSPQRVDVDICAPPKTIAHALYPCPQHLKTPLVLRLLDKTDTNSVLIFTRTKHRANRVAKQISTAGYEAGVLHSNKSQNQRQSALDDFRAGRCRILVATDIAARGLDIETISHVINYDIPDTADTYIHRIGRTGRMEREGDAITLVTKEDTAMVFDIEKVLGSPIERRKLDDFDYNAPAPPKAEIRRPPMPARAPKPEAVKVVAQVQPAEQPGGNPVAQDPGRSSTRRRYRRRQSDTRSASG